MSTYQRRENQPQYFHPRNVDRYWREAVQQEMDKVEQANPGTFSQPEPATVSQ